MPMTVMLDNSCRLALAMELSDIQCVHQLLTEADEVIRDLLEGSAHQEKFSTIAVGNLEIRENLKSIMVQYGVKSSPKLSTVLNTEKSSTIFFGSEFTLMEKLGEYGLLLTKNITCGNLVHKSAQVLAPDVKVALAPLNMINSVNKSHLSEISVMTELIGVQQLIGKSPDESVVGSIKDTVSRFTGAVASRFAEPMTDWSITKILTMDHRKASALFKEIQSTNNPAKLQEYFGQLYKDLRTHAIAEEEIFYRAVENTETIGSVIDDSYKEHDEMRLLLEEIRQMDVTSVQFKTRCLDLQRCVDDHVKDEESFVFDAAEANLEDEILCKLGREFVDRKEQIQQEILNNSEPDAPFVQDHRHVS